MSEDPLSPPVLPAIGLIPVLVVFRYHDAIGTLSAKLLDFPNSRAALSLLAYCHYYISDYNNALQLYERLCKVRALECGAREVGRLAVGIDVMASVSVGSDVVRASD